MRLMLCTNCSAVSSAMGFNHLQKIPAYLTTKDTTYKCEYSGTLVCRLVSVDVTAQGRAGVMSSRTVCAYVLLETWKCVNSHHSGTVGSFGVSPERTITKTEHYARHTCRALQAIFNQTTVKDFKGGGREGGSLKCRQYIV